MCRIRSCEHILRDDIGKGLGRLGQFRPTESVSTEALTGMSLCITDLVVTESDPHGAHQISQSTTHFAVFIHLVEES